MAVMEVSLGSAWLARSRTCICSSKTRRAGGNFDLAQRGRHPALMRHRRRRSAATVITCADRTAGFTCQQARQREDIMDRRDFLQSTLAATAGAAGAASTGAAAAVTDGEPPMRLAQAGAASVPAGVAEAAHHGPGTRRWSEPRVAL